MSSVNSAAQLALGGRRIMVLGGRGFIGSNLVQSLLAQGHAAVCDVDKKPLQTTLPPAASEVVLDLSAGWQDVLALFREFRPDIVMQLAADMGGAGYIFGGRNDTEVMTESVQINANVIRAASRCDFIQRVVFSSSACIYPHHNQTAAFGSNCAEASAFPPSPDSAYGWEKIYSELMYDALTRNHGISTGIVRFHNVYGPLGVYAGGREKAPAAMIRKAYYYLTGQTADIEIWGTGEQSRSFLYVDDAVEALSMMMAGSHAGPYNVGSTEEVSINQLAAAACAAVRLKLAESDADLPAAAVLRHVASDQIGVQGRNSVNDRVRAELGWDWRTTLQTGLERTASWIVDEIRKPLAD